MFIGCLTHLLALLQPLHQEGDKVERGRKRQDEQRLLQFAGSHRSHRLQQVVHGGHSEQQRVGRQGWQGCLPPSPPHGMLRFMLPLPGGLGFDKLHRLTQVVCGS
eukprot:200590-Prorocentrum_minimum.AAC.1